MMGLRAGLFFFFFFFFLRKPFEIIDSQYQLCPHFELPEFTKKNKNENNGNKTLSNIAKFT